ncbi:MAG: PP2C family protein-serine/threonine phosphatase, partial [Gemmatimonadota bacterium]
MPGVDDLLEAVSRVDARPFRVSMVRDGERSIVHDDLGDAPVEERRTFEGRAVTTELELGASTDPESPGLFPLVGTVVDHLARTTDLLSVRDRELRDRREVIELLTFISRTLGSVIRLDDAASAILGKLVDVTGADRATLWSHDPEAAELRLLASKGRADPVVRSVTVEHPDSLVAHVWRGQQTILAGPEPAAMAGLPPSVQSGFEGRALLAVPVTYAPPQGEPRRVGVLNLVGAPGDPAFRAADRELVAAIASQVGAALENGRLVREELARERLRAELGLAHDLQLRLLPDPDDFRDLFDVAARCDPADSVGGDFYQLARLPGDRLGVLLGDVSS